MTKLGITVDDLPEQVTEPDQYTIKAVAVKQLTRFGVSDRLTLTNTKGDRSLYLQHSDHVTSRSNLGKLVKAFGDDPDRWVGKRIKVTFDEDGKRKIEPVVAK